MNHLGFRRDDTEWCEFHRTHQPVNVGPVEVNAAHCEDDAARGRAS